MSTKDIHIIGQGTYGCVYKPHFDCKTKKPKAYSKNFLSKIQKYDEVTKNEINIGERVKKIYQYRNRFAPIEETCDITIGEITDSGIEKCKMLTQYEKQFKKNPKKSIDFKSTKIYYAGKDSLHDHLESEIISKDTKNKSKANTYLKKIINSHLYLLESLILFKQNKLLHLDIKHNNIIHNGKSPIIIDFGISYYSEKLSMDKYVMEERPFGIKAPFYIPWPIEIILLSHISHDKIDDSDKEKQNLLLNTPNKDSYLLDIFKLYQEKHLFLQSKKIFSDDERKEYNEKITNWLKTLENKTWREIWVILTRSQFTWDNYSVAVMYLIELQISGLLDISKVIKEEKSQSSYLVNYINSMKKMITSLPEEREEPEETLSKYKTLFSKIPKNDHKKVVSKLDNMLSINANIDEMKKQRAIINAETVKNEDISKKLIKA